ncbi:hypothetical protein HMPREF0239_00166 [Clostridium sp. ATCC BAA-442]|nr:hypothetical protein HMPREF0239_00166 [Clostridium sp. ATCC BAA-442]
MQSTKAKEKKSAVPRCSAPKGLDRQCIELEIVQAAERACCLLSTDGKPFHLAQTDCCLP